ncbi:hypothetical protein HK101_002076 [Irineochytrium annulatum]|nr:hypothetical protein HK101_002076 [Irineochytrium annulatum]
MLGEPAEKRPKRAAANAATSKLTRPEAAKAQSAPPKAGNRRAPPPQPRSRRQSKASEPAVKTQRQSQQQKKKKKTAPRSKKQRVDDDEQQEEAPVLEREEVQLIERMEADAAMGSRDADGEEQDEMEGEDDDGAEAEEEAEDDNEEEGNEEDDGDELDQLADENGPTEQPKGQAYNGKRFDDGDSTQAHQRRRVSATLPISARKENIFLSSPPLNAAPGVKSPAEQQQHQQRHHVVDGNQRPPLPGAAARQGSLHQPPQPPGQQQQKPLPPGLGPPPGTYHPQQQQGQLQGNGYGQMPLPAGMESLIGVADITKGAEITALLSNIHNAMLQQRADEDRRYRLIETFMNDIKTVQDKILSAVAEVDEKL